MFVPICFKALALAWPLSDHFPVFFSKAIDLPYQKDVNDNRGGKYNCYFNLKFSFHKAELVMKLGYNKLGLHA